MHTIAICDDDEEHLEFTASLIRNELSSVPCTVDAFLSADSLLTRIEFGGYRPDVIVLDIELGQQNGIELARDLNRGLPSARIIFLTGYSKYISASYEAEHVWYVLKTQAKKYLGPALRRALEPVSPLPASSLTVKDEGKTVVVPLSELLYFVREKRRLLMVCTQGVYHVNTPPEALLPDTSKGVLLRCHQSYWVNLRQVIALDHEEFVLSSGQRVPIGRTHRTEARERFFARYRE